MTAEELRELMIAALEPDLGEDQRKAMGVQIRRECAVRAAMAAEEKRLAVLQALALDRRLEESREAVRQAVRRAKR